MGKKNKPKGPKNPPQSSGPKEGPSKETKPEPTPQIPPTPVESKPQVEAKPPPAPVESKPPPAPVETKPPPEPSSSDKKEEQPPVKPKRHRNRKKKHSESSEHGSIGSFDEKSATPEPQKPEPKVEKVETPKLKQEEQHKKVDQKKNVDLKEIIEKVPEKIEPPKPPTKKSKQDKKNKEPADSNITSDIATAAVQPILIEEIIKPPEITAVVKEVQESKPDTKNVESKSKDNKKNKKPKDNISEIHNIQKEECPMKKDAKKEDEIKQSSSKADIKAPQTKENVKQQLKSDLKEEVTHPIKEEKQLIKQETKQTEKKEEPKKCVIDKNISKKPADTCIQESKDDGEKHASEEACKIAQQPKDKKQGKKGQKSKEEEHIKTEPKASESSVFDLPPITSADIKHYDLKEDFKHDLSLERKEDIMMDTLGTSIEETLKKLIVCESDLMFGEQLLAADMKHEEEKEEDKHKSHKSKSKKDSKHKDKVEDKKVHGEDKDHSTKTEEKIQPLNKEEFDKIIVATIEGGILKDAAKEEDKSMMIQMTEEKKHGDKKEDEKHKSHKNKSKKDSKHKEDPQLENISCEMKGIEHSQKEGIDKIILATIEGDVSTMIKDATKKKDSDTVKADNSKIEIEGLATSISKDEKPIPVIKSEEIFKSDNLHKAEDDQKIHEDKKHKKGKKSKNESKEHEIARTASPLPETKIEKKETDKTEDVTSQINIVRSTIPEDIIQALLSNDPPKFIDESEKLHHQSKGDKKECKKMSDKKSDEKCIEIGQPKQLEITGEVPKSVEIQDIPTKLEPEISKSESSETHKHAEKHQKHKKGKNDKYETQTLDSIMPIFAPIDIKSMEEVPSECKLKEKPTEIQEKKCGLDKKHLTEESVENKNLEEVKKPDEKATGSPKLSKKIKDKKHKHEKSQSEAKENIEKEETKDSSVSSPTSEENFEIVNICPGTSKKENLKPDEPPRGKSPVQQPSKNLHGPLNIPAKSNKTDFKKEKNKPPHHCDAKKNIEHVTEDCGVVITEEACSTTLDDDEDTEFVYKYSFRVVYIANACQVCKVQLKDDRVVCRFCHLVGYCFEKHRDEDWSQHQSLCYAICTLSHVKALEHIYADAKGLNGQDYRLLRMQSIVSCEKLLKRKLCPWEQEVLLYPRMCYSPSCREWRSDLLKDCEKCGQVSFCSNHPEHLDKGHEEWCSSYGLYHSLVNHQLTKGRIEPILPSMIVDTGYVLPEKCSKLLEDLYGCVINMDECHYATLTQLSTAPLTALFSYQKTMAKNPTKETFCIHVIGAELQFEADTPNKWEVFFLHLVPEIKELKIVFVGPELNVSKLPVELLTKIRMCPQCRFQNRRVKFEFHDEVLYHDFIETDQFTPPDFICAFNPGFHRITGYAGLDTWPDTIKCALRLKVPLCCTAYTSAEAPRDISRILECCGGPSAVKVLMEPKKNPYRSRRPDRNFVSDDDAPLIFKNYYVSVVTATN